MKRGTKRFFIVLSILFLLLVAWIVSQSNLSYPNNGAKDLVISRETTYVTDAPRNPDGTVNYCAWLDAYLSEGVTKENNAAIPFLRALGPRVIEIKYRSYILDKLGLSDLPNKGEYFISWEKFTSKQKTVATKPSSTPAAKTKSDKKALSKRLDRTTRTPWTPKDFPDVAKWMQANEKPLSLIEEGSRRSNYYLPIPLKQKNPEIYDSLSTIKMNQYRNTAKALTARAMLTLGNGDIQGAWNDTMTTRRLARRIGDCPTIVNMLVGVSAELLATKTQQYLLSRETLSTKQVRTMRHDLKTLPPLRGMGGYINYGERLFGLDCVMKLVRGDLDDIKRSKMTQKGASELGIDWNRLLRDLNQQYDLMAESCLPPTAPGRIQAWNQFENHIQNTFGKKTDGSSKWKFALILRMAPRSVRREYFTILFRDILISVLMPSLGRAQTLLDLAVTQGRLTEVTAALALYRAEHGRWPESLKDLTPDILPTVPIDPWSEKPLIYRRDGTNFILYSIGPNGKDNGGVAEENTEKDDLVVDSDGK